MSAETVPARPSPLARIGARARDTVRPMYDAVIGDPMREGRLRLEGAGVVSRQAAVVGLVALLALLASLIAGDLWRRGTLVFLSETFGRPTFIPLALFPVTLLALSVAWTLLLWGAARASPLVRLAIAAGFLMLNAPIGAVLLVQLGGEGFALVPFLIRFSYFAIPAVLVAYALAGLREGWARRLRPAALALLAALPFLFFGSLLWAHVLQERNGVPPHLPFTLENALGNIESLFVPLVILSAVVLIEFGRGLASGAAVPGWRWWSIVARLAVLVLIGVKLWIQLVRHLGDWARFWDERAADAIWTVVFAAGLGAGAWFLARFPRHPASAEEAKERIVYSSALVLALPGLLFLVMKTLIDFLLIQGRVLSAAEWLDGVPVVRILSGLDAVLWMGVVGAGVWLLTRRADRPFAREAGLGYVLVGTWAAVHLTLEFFDRDPSFSAPLADILLTAGAGAYLLARWRTVGTEGAVKVGALVAFSWLLMTKGDFLTIAGGFLGLPAVFIVVFGVLWVLLADSSFASGDSRRFPRASRPLLWVGYLVLSVAILNWSQATHGVEATAQVGGRGWFYVGLPLAVWLVTRNPFRPPAGTTSTSATA